jgi:hypothetical protein
MLPVGVQRVPDTLYAIDPAKPWIRYYPELEQGSEAWLQARCGLLTASEMKLAITPTLKVANNDKTRMHVWELLSQRISGFVEPTYIGDAMLRGHEDEILAAQLYEENYGGSYPMGFVTNSRHGFTLGYSPDRLIGADGLWECKSRVQKYQVQTIAGQEPPPEFMLQLQTGLLVTERKWIDFTSYSGGLPMVTMRVWPDLEIQTAILEAAAAFEANIAFHHEQYQAALVSPNLRLIPTERRVIQEMYA